MLKTQSKEPPSKEPPIPIGYEALRRMYGLKTIPHFRESYVLSKGTPRTFVEDHQEIHYYAKQYLPKNPQDPFAHIEFALKHEGLNLEIFFALFQQIEKRYVLEYIKKHPTGKTARKLWFLYEYLTEEELAIENATSGSYVLLLDPEFYYTAHPIRSKRHYVDNNLLGNRKFCPMVRRTTKLQNLETKDLSKIATQMLGDYDPSVILRAVNYLYIKETMSSYQIEREKPDTSRTNRFVDILKRSDTFGSLTKEILIELQNSIVDPRFQDKEYRDFQNYVGSQIRLDGPGYIDYIAPKPENVPQLMQGLLGCMERMCQSQVHAVVIASVIAFGFVFIHPFEDGNGRLHRFLIHYIFSRQKFVPKGAIFPVSSVILKDMNSYDAILESFSRPLMKLLHYELNELGELKVIGLTDGFYRSIDMTLFVEYLFDCVDKTIQTDFKNELNYLVHFDMAKSLLQEIVDMPDKKLFLFIRFVSQNGGSLSKKKREEYFPQLTDEEISQMETVIKKHLC